MSSTKTTVKVSAIKVYSALRDLEDRLHAVGAHTEAAAVRVQKLAVIRNMGVEGDKTQPTIIPRASATIDWNGY